MKYMTHENMLITGGAGFIGSNLANRLLNQGHHVTIFDNLSRSGCEQNVAWLRETHDPVALDVIQADVTDFNTLKRAAEGVTRFYHLAGQVAVTTSVINPRHDFENNALGTFNALEAARLVSDNPIFIYASTNKVYGSMEDIQVVERNTRYEYTDLPLGIPETQPLDFHSPYGCSKGTGDQYTRDYARIYGLRSIVMRQSCIYGYRQFGIEDQGWIAWFLIAALKKFPIKIYGNGKQVRDVLFIDDLLDAYDAATERITMTAGQVYNIGGGCDNTISVWVEFGQLLEGLLNKHIPLEYRDWRPGDQPIYISDIRKAERELDWHPKVSIKQGIPLLYEWIRENGYLFNHLKNH
jgi:CDP-paratose 2-epimerase